MGSWAENYGANYQQDGPNFNLALGAARTVRFYYDHKTHYIADNVRNTIYTIPGNYGPAIGCPEWAPDCLGSLMSDTDSDGVFTLVTDDIGPGTYEFKVATNESWSNPNYGAGGGPDNVVFSVPGTGYEVTFSFNTANNTPTVTLRSLAPPGDVEWDGVRHDSRDTLYRTPGGAVPAGTPVTLRLRTFHDDVTAVTLRLYDANAAGQRLIPMQRAAAGVSCYQADLDDETCDFWAATVEDDEPNNLWYRFIVTDGGDTDYYADNTSALDGGQGLTTDDAVDQSYALTVYDPDFAAPQWARSAVIYQIFPDRFRNGNPSNDPQDGDERYDDPAIFLPWGTLPEGYCRNYADGEANCPWRFDNTPPATSPTKEQPRGRDYYGGDLAGVTSQLDYLKLAGVTAIYFNPIFYAKSNHRYDTADYYQIDPYLGTLQDFKTLVTESKKRGIKIILDGVYNHMSSDSPLFDRYQHFGTVGACEAGNSAYRQWFNFRPPTGSEPQACAPSTPGGDDTYYNGWFGFDSIPEIKKSNPAVQDYFLNDPNSVTRYWLDQGAAAWRLDVMGDASFPNGYWEAFREIVKQEDPNALIIGELWQKDGTLLRFLRGDRADTTMNYRLRDAVIGLLAPGSFDSKGFGDSGRVIEPSEFAARIEAIREDYPDAAFYTLMNLLDSHDTERIRWTLTPGAETIAAKEQNAANVAAGKQRQRLASLIQYTMPGAPTVYYGDEAGMTGDDDPDDRRTFPWPDQGGSVDSSMLAHYRSLAQVRSHSPALTEGDLRVLLADDAADTTAYGRKTTKEAAVVAINRSAATRTLDIPVAGYLPNGTTLLKVYGVGNSATGSVTVSQGKLTVTLNPLSGLILAGAKLDLLAPANPSGLSVSSEGSHQVGLAWGAVSGAAGYNVYRSPLSGGGWVKVNASPITGTSYTDTGLRNARTYYYVVTALDAPGNESGHSNQVSALPHDTIGWANLQWPPSMQHTISTTDRTDDAYGQVWIDGVTGAPGATEGLLAQLGFGPDGSNPAGNNQWTWVDARFNTDAGNNDEFAASLLPEATGTYDYAYRYSTTNGREWVYADQDGIGNGYSPAQAGSLTVNSSGDTSAPAVPTGLHVVSESPAGIELTWNAITGDSSLYGYEVRRAAGAGGPYTTLALVTGTSYTDTGIAEGATYYYVVRAVDSSFNRSAHSSEVHATAALRTVTLVFTITVPPPVEDAVGKTVYIAGALDRLDGGLPAWNPGGVALTEVDSTHWTITLTGKEGTQIEYKYALGSWDYVEKDGACGEINNRQLTLSYGGSGTQNVNDSVLNWRNVTPCGN